MFVLRTPYPDGGSAPRGNISFVGSGGTTTVHTTGTSYDFSSLVDATGGTPTIQEGDYVFVEISHGGTSIHMGSIAGYSTVFGSAISSSDSTINTFQQFYKKMGATPDTSVAIPGGSASGSSQAVTVYVLRGVHPTTPLDVTPTSATGNNGGNPNPPAITPATAGAWLIITGAMCSDTTVGAPAAFSNPSGMSAVTNHFRTTSATATSRHAAIGTSLKTDWVSGSFDCGAFSTGNNHARQAWCAAAVALRPA